LAITPANVAHGAAFVVQAPESLGFDVPANPFHPFPLSVEAQLADGPVFAQTYRVVL
jgi:hypothetical protein